jgi:predicted nuclease of predicted toxin-antitoxin system
MKLLLDMNLSPRWVTTLRDAGFEALHWSTCGRSGAPDTEIMAFAKANGALLTVEPGRTRMRVLPLLARRG